MESIAEIRKLAKKILKEKGFQYPDQDGGTLFVYKELDRNRLCYSFTLKDRRESKFITCSCTFITNELGEAINYIDEQNHRVFPQNRLNSKEWARVEISAATIENYIDRISNDALELASCSSFSDRLQDILSTVNRPGSHQSWHIAALAAKKVIGELTMLLEGLSSVDRGGLWPYIKENHIKRAIQYAKRPNASQENEFRAYGARQPKARLRH
jgi:hypothetical protein